LQNLAQSLAVSVRVERRWPLFAGLAAAGLWAAAAAGAALLAMPPAPSPAALAGLAAAVLPPLALALLFAALLPLGEHHVELAEAETRLAGARDDVGNLAAALAAVDAQLADSVERCRSLAEIASRELPGLGGSASALVEAATRVVESGGRTAEVTTALGEALPALARTVGEIDVTLRTVGGDSATQLRAVEAMLATVQSRSREAAAQADVTIANLTGLLARIDEASTRNTTALSKRAYALDTAVDGVLERATAAVDHIRDTMEGQLLGLKGGVETAGAQLASFGDDNLRAFNARLDVLMKTSASLQAAFAEHEAAAARLHEGIASQIAALGEGMAALGSDGAATTDRLAAGLDDVATRLGDLGEPLAGVRAGVAALDGDVGQLGDVMAGTTAAIEARLAAAQAGMAALVDEANRLAEAARGLGTDVDDSSGRIDAAATALADQQAAMMTAGEALSARVDAARAALADVADGSTAAADYAAATLAGEMSRLAEAGDAAAEALRARLAAVVDDSVAILASTGREAAEAAFGSPVRAELAALAAAAERTATVGSDTARRLAGQMLVLLDSIATTEARIDEVETQLAVRERHSLAGAAARLIGQLRESVVDVSRLLMLPVAEADWALYLRGETDVFARVVAPLLDRDAQRQIARLISHDEEFRTEASHYLGRFDALVGGLLGSRDGDALAATMLSSDLGKLYVTLAEAAGRLPPAARRLN